MGASVSVDIGAGGGGGASEASTQMRVETEVAALETAAKHIRDVAMAIRRDLACREDYVRVLSKTQFLKLESVQIRQQASIDASFRMIRNDLLKCKPKGMLFVSFEVRPLVYDSHIISVDIGSIRDMINDVAIKGSETFKKPIGRTNIKLYFKNGQELTDADVPSLTDSTEIVARIYGFDEIGDVVVSVGPADAGSVVTGSAEELV